MCVYKCVQGIGGMLPDDSALKVQVHRRVVGKKFIMDFFFLNHKNSLSERFLSGICHL